MTGQVFWALVVRRVRGFTADRIPLIGALLTLLLVATLSSLAMWEFTEAHKDPTTAIRAFGWGDFSYIFNLFALFLGFVGIPLEFRSGRAIPILAHSVSRELYYLSSWTAGALFMAAFELVRSGAVLIWVVLAGGEVFCSDFLGIACFIFTYWLLLALSSLLGSILGPGYGFVAWFAASIFSSYDTPLIWLRWFVPKILSFGEVKDIVCHVAANPSRGWDILLHHFSWTGFLVIAGMLILKRKEIHLR